MLGKDCGVEESGFLRLEYRKQGHEVFSTGATCGREWGRFKGRIEFFVGRKDRRV